MIELIAAFVAVFVAGGVAAVALLWWIARPTPQEISEVERFEAERERRNQYKTDRQICL